MSNWKSCNCFLSLLCFVGLIGFSGCKEPASDVEIKDMCLRLLELRNSTDDQEMFRSCVEEAGREETSRQQALCRIQAVNKLEYWNRCRTGKPRH